MVKKVLVLTAALGILLLMGASVLARGEETRFELSVKLGLLRHTIQTQGILLRAYPA